jgi:site-specific recombinase XerD
MNVRFDAGIQRAVTHDGVNVRVIQVLGRHKDTTTTQRYINFNDNKLLNAIELVS